jgi:hypothetical protein
VCCIFSQCVSSAYYGYVRSEFVLQTDTTYGHTYNTLGEGLNASGMDPAAALPSHASLADMEKATVLSFEYMGNSKVKGPLSIERERERVGLVDSHGRWTGPCLQTTPVCERPGDAISSCRAVGTLMER